MITSKFISFLNSKDWRCDQYRWSNQRVKKLPRKQPHIKTTYFNVHTPKGDSSEFQRHSYQLLDPSCKVTLVHYLGDENKFAHRNSIDHTKRSYMQTCPSVLRDIEDALLTLLPRCISQLLPLLPHKPVLQPRNSKQ